MIHPSYVDLMEVVNKNVEEGETPVINSRYSIVMATAKRARQIVDGDEPLVKVSRGEKPLSIAVDELNQEEIRILAEDEIEEEYVDPADEAAAAEEEADALLQDQDVAAEAAGEEDVTAPLQDLAEAEEAEAADVSADDDIRADEDQPEPDTTEETAE